MPLVGRQRENEEAIEAVRTTWAATLGGCRTRARWAVQDVEGDPRTGAPHRPDRGPRSAQALAVRRHARVRPPSGFRREVSARAECARCAIPRGAPVRTDLPLPDDVLSSYKEKDDAWSAFFEAIKEPSADTVVLRDTVPAQTILAPSKEDV